MTALAVFALLFSSASPMPDDLAARIDATPAGATLDLVPGATYRITSPLVLQRPIRIVGHGARIVAADGAGIAGAVIASVGVDQVRLEDLVINANVDRGGADYGVWIRGGSGHHLAGLDVADTSQACLLLEDASGTVEKNTVDRCGRELTIRRGGAANNHAIMVAALARSVSGVTISGNVVSQAYRKGITAYARSPGSLSDVTIANNRISGAGLGAVYVANAPRTPSVQRVTIRGNTTQASYVGFEIDDVVDLSLDDNVAEDMRDRSGRPGAEGLILHAVRNAEIRGLSIRRSGSGGVSVIDSQGVRLIAPSIVDGNTGNNGYAPAIQLRGSRGSSVEDMSIVDTHARPALTHGFVEIGPAGGNRSSVRRMEGILRPSLRMER